MKTVFAFLSSVLFFCFSEAQTVAKTSRIKIHAAPAGLAKIREAGIDFDHGYYDADASTYINTFDAAVVQQIRNMGFRVDVLVEDVVAYTDSINQAESHSKYGNVPVKAGPQLQALATNFTAPCQSNDTYIAAPTSFLLGSMGGFYNLVELQAQLDDMVAKYPGLVSIGSIGNTLQSRPIPFIKISDNVATDEDEAEVMYTGMNHAREGMSMMNLMFFMRYILENYATNNAIKEIVDSRELFFIPVVNIDGFNYNTTAANWAAGKRFRRKNMRETTTSTEASNGSGGDGVDINRNYGTYWGSSYELTSTTGQTGSSGTVSSDAYRGTAAFSEPETQRVRDFVNGRNFKVALNYHCYGNWWIRPQGPDVTRYPATALATTNVNIFNSIAALFTKYNCYVYGTPKQTVYAVNGYSDDYLFTGSPKAPIYAFSPEVGAAADDFWCPSNKIIPYAKELVFPNLQAAYTAGSYAELQDNSDVAVTGTTGTFSFTVTRKGLTDGPIKITLLPVTNIQYAGAPVNIASITSFGSISSGSINYTLSPTLSAGSVIRYAWKLETGGISITDTVTKIFNPTVVFTDDMETAGNFTAKWVKSTGSAWGYAANGFNSTASLSESPSGNYSNSADQTVRFATAVDLSSATEAYLSFMVKYQTENCQDRLQVEISTTGVTGTYTPICTRNTIKENRGLLGGTPSLTGSTDGWVRETVDLKNYLGNTNLSLRFRFLSSSANREAYLTNGFNIDNIKIIKTNAFVMPVRFEDLTATRINEAVLLRWKSQTDEQFAYYEVQRSQNGSEFTTLYRIENAANQINSYIDKAPAAGFNYYRIKGVDQDGSARFSKTILIIFTPNTPVTIYPNPVSDQMTIVVNSQRVQDVQAELVSLDGLIVSRQSFHLKKGTNTFRINMHSYNGRLYVLRIKDVLGTVIKEEKILKTK